MDIVFIIVINNELQEKSLLVTSAFNCDKCSYEYCECDGTCDENDGTRCYRCDTWLCGNCVVDGMCNNCFAKLQGGVQ